MTEIYTLEALARAAHTIASHMVRGTGDWNSDYPAALDVIGFELVPVDKGAQLGPTGPLMAPLPADEGAPPYRYPCVIAPKGWKPDKLEAQ